MKRASAVVVLTRAEVETKAEKTARDLLGTSYARAIKRLDRGELRGTLAEVYLSQLRHLLASRGHRRRARTSAISRSRR